MNRAVVVLLLLIANVIVGPGRTDQPDSVQAPRTDYSLGLFTIVDGASLAEVGTPRCGVQSAFDRSLANITPQELSPPLGRRSAPSLPQATEEDLCATKRLYDVRL